MKNSKCCAALLVLLIAVGTADAYTYWRITGTNWADPASWDNGVPTASDGAVIWNGTATVTENGEICKSLQLAGGAGNFHGHVIISSGSLEVVNTMQIGPVGYGTVNMTSGLLKANTIVLSQDRYNPSYIDISGNAEIQCYYFEVGWPGVGHVTQNGGTITANELALTNYNEYSRGEGYYTLSAGTLNVGAVYVGIIKGEFKVTNPGVTINITDGFHIHPNGTLTVPAGAILHLKGAKFSCRKTVSSEIPDLANLTLSFEAAGGRESSLEAAGMDRGANSSVLTDNFVVDTVSIEPGVNVRLVNLVDNNTSDPAADAACTQELELGDGSLLILGSLNMYCRDWSHNFSTVDWRTDGSCLYVLNASYDMGIESSESEIKADGATECTISTVLSDRGTPIGNAYVRFNTDQGTLNGGSSNVFWARTDAVGRATVQLRSNTEACMATVTASYMDYSEQTTVDFVKVQLSVTADPPVIPADGTSKSVIEASLEYKNAPVTDESICLETEIGWFVTPGSGELVSSITLVTDAEGKVSVELLSENEEIAGYVTAIWEDQTERVLVDFIGYELRLSAVPVEIACGGQSYSTIKALLTRAGQPIAGEAVNFQTTLGILMPPGQTPGTEAAVDTDESGRAMLLLKSADDAGDAVITATYEKLSRDVTVAFREDVLNIAADPETIGNVSTSTSEIMMVLMLDKVPAAGKTIIVSTDKGHLYDELGLVTDTAQTDGDGIATVFFKPDGDEGAVLISAEYSDAEVIVNGNCAVTIEPISMDIKALKADYKKVPGTGAEDVTTRSITEPDPVQVTLYGKTEVVVEIQMEPEGIPEIAGQTILLESFERDLIDSSIIIDIPESVVTDENGKAEFTVMVDELWKMKPIFDKISVTAKWEDDASISNEIEIEVYNNWERLIQFYEDNLPSGPVLEPEFWEYLHRLAEDADCPEAFWLGDNLGFLRMHLINSGKGGGINNVLEAALKHYSLPNNWNTRMEKCICGEYQGAVLDLFNNLRWNTSTQGTTDWLFNGIDYGPIYIEGGLHVAAMMYPRTAWYLHDWRGSDTRILDPWPTQDPYGAVYTWHEWVQLIGISGLGTYNELALNGTIAPYSFDPFNPMNQLFPANGKPYPPAEFHSVTQYTGETKFLVHCPVYITIEDEQGRRSGYRAGAGADESPFIMEIPDVLFSTLGMPDGTMLWQFRLPKDEMKIKILGYEEGDFSALLVDGQGETHTYTGAGIGNEQTAEVTYDPNSTSAAKIVYSDGTEVFPDGVIEIKSWNYSSSLHQSSGTLKITNTTATAVYAPLRLVIESTAPDTISLVNPDGTEGGKSYIDLTSLTGDGMLDPGESISRVIEFANLNREYFDLSVKLTGQTAEAKNVTARRKYSQVGIPECSREGLLPFDLAEGNAADWETWVEEMEPEGTFVFDDTDTLTAGRSSVMCVTDAPFDMYIRYGQTLTSPWDLSSAKKLFINFYACNNSTFQNGSPWIRLKTDDDNYFHFQYYLDGYSYDLLNDCLWQWKTESIALDASESEENGWRRTTVGSPDWSQIRYLEIHADTWDSGFQLGVDGVGFDTDRAIYRDFNSDCNVDTLDLTMLVEHWLCPDCTPMTCEGTDIDLSKKVDMADFVLFAKYWLEGNTQYLPYDIVPDGEINMEDLQVLINQWLAIPGSPSADIAPGPLDNVVNIEDFALLAAHWLEGT